MPAASAFWDRFPSGALILFVWSIFNEMRQWRHLCHAFWRQNHLFKILNGHYQRLHTSFYKDRLILHLSSKSDWFTAMAVAFHPGIPKSIPGEGKLFIYWRQKNAACFFHFSTLNSDVILALIQPDFRLNSDNFFCLTQNFGNFQQISIAIGHRFSS